MKDGNHALRFPKGLYHLRKEVESRIELLTAVIKWIIAVLRHEQDGIHGQLPVPSVRASGMDLTTWKLYAVESR
jgi:hypothetical protein